MEKEAKQLNLYQKLLEVKKQVPYLQKDKAGHQYQYASPSQVLGVINPLLNEMGIILKTEVVECKAERIFAKPKAFDVWINKVNTPQVHDLNETMFHLKMKMTWVCVDSGQMDVNEFFSAGVNGDEKGLGSALTYAERYFILKYFNIPTDSDDPDSFQTKHLSAEQLAKMKQEEEEAQRKAIAELYNKAITELSAITDTAQFTAFKEKYANLFPHTTLKQDTLKRFEEVKLAQQKSEANVAGILKKKADEEEAVDEIALVEETVSLTEDAISKIATYTNKAELSTWALKTLKTLEKAKEPADAIESFKQKVNDKVSSL
jgi:hypothetical protein